MKAVINGLLYDTDKAERLGETHAAGLGPDDFKHFEEALYKTKGGKYFLAGEGGPMTDYAKPHGQNGLSGGSRITPMSGGEAREWGERHMDADTFVKVFGAVKEA